MEIKIAQSKDELIDHYLIRKEVFINEQDVTWEEEFDFIEKECYVFLVFNDNQAVGTARLRFIGNIAKIERVCVLKKYRNKRIGKFLIEHMIAFSKDKCIEIQLGAQVQAIPFYQKCGFSVYGELFYDANIAHFHMKREP